MNLNTLNRLITGLTVFSLASWLVTAGAALQPDDRVRAQVREPGFAKTGAVVHLFYGMSKNAKEEFCPGATVTVYRLPTDKRGEIYHSKYEVGKVRVTKNLENRFVEAKVVEGNIRSGDMAMQSSTECYVNTHK